MASIFNYIKSFLLDSNPGLIGTYGNPAAPATGDTDWSGVNASTSGVDEGYNLTNGQLLIGKTGTAAVSNPASAPVLTAGTSGSLASGTYEVAYSWKKDAYSETQVSPTASITFASGTTNKINVAAVTPLPPGITSVNWYMSDAPGSITLKFIANNAGTAFSISTLPIGGALPVPSSNTTATNNHPTKGTITGSNGVGVTNGPGSITLGLAVSGDISATAGVVSVTGVNGVAVTGTPSTGQVITATGTSAAHWATPSGGTTIASGTAFPGSPSSGDLFIRTDLKTTNRFNGTTWDVIGFTNTLTSAHINVGNGSNVATDVAMSGDATIANTGAVTVGKVNGIAVTGTPAVGYVPTATSTTAATWQAPSGGGGGGISSGTTFPGTPATNDLFYRTDRSLLYFYNGSAWLSSTLYKHQLVFSAGFAEPITATGAVPIRAGAMDSDFSIYIEKAFAPFAMSSTPYDASNFWSAKLFYVNQTSPSANQLSTTQTTWATGRTAGPRYVLVFTVGVTHTVTDQGLYYIEYDKTGGPAGLYPDTGVIQYRLVG